MISKEEHNRNIEILKDEISIKVYDCRTNETKEVNGLKGTELEFEKYTIESRDSTGFVGDINSAEDKFEDLDKLYLKEVDIPHNILYELTFNDQYFRELAEALLNGHIS